jgi:hypothetical protein
MQAFPTEILLNIFGFVEKAGLKALRLVSRRFNAIAPVILFMSVNASPHDEDLEVLQLISEHSIFRHYVREVIYFEVYFHIDEFYRKPIETAKDPTLQPGVHVSIIAAALARMPNLRGLILKNHWLPPRDDPAYVYSEEDLKNPAPYGPRTSRHFPPEEIRLRDTIPVECEIGHQPGSDGYDYGFEVMHNALATSDLWHLQSLSVDYIYNEYDCKYISPWPFPHGLYPATFLKMSPLDLEYTCNAFRHFRKISLGLNWESFHSGATTHKYNLAKILGAAENLEELKLNFNMVSNYDDECFSWPLHHILGTRTWSRLQSLYLSNKHVDGKELADLVYRHHKTLKSLQLWRIHLQRGLNWWTWAESAQPWISSSLERIEFTPSWYEKRFEASLESECCLKNYILLGHYKRDCCPASRLFSKDQTDEEVIRICSKKRFPEPYRPGRHQ